MSKAKIFTQLQAAIKNGDFDEFKKIWEKILAESLEEDYDLIDPLNKSFIFEDKFFPPLFFTAIKGPNLAIADFLLNWRGEDFGIPDVDISTSYLVDVTDTDYAFSSKAEQFNAPRLDFFSERDGLSSAKTSPVITPLTLAIFERNFELAKQIIEQYVKKAIVIKAEDFFLALYEAIQTDYQISMYEIITEDGNVHTAKPIFIDLLLSQVSANQKQAQIFSFVTQYLKPFSEKHGKKAAQWIGDYFHTILKAQAPEKAAHYLNSVNAILQEGSDHALEKNKEKVEIVANDFHLDLDLLKRKIDEKFQKKLATHQGKFVKGERSIDYRIFDATAQYPLVIFQACSLSNLYSDLLSLSEVIEAFENSLRDAIRHRKTAVLHNATYTLLLPFIYNESGPSKVSLAEITLNAEDYPIQSLAKKMQIHSIDTLSASNKKMLAEVAGKNRFKDPEYYHPNNKNRFYFILQLIFNKLAQLLKKPRSDLEFQTTLVEERSSTWAQRRLENHPGWASFYRPLNPNPNQVDEAKEADRVVFSKT